MTGTAQGWVSGDARISTTRINFRAAWLDVPRQQRQYQRDSQSTIFLAVTSRTSTQAPLSEFSRTAVKISSPARSYEVFKYGHTLSFGRRIRRPSLPQVAELSLSDVGHFIRPLAIKLTDQKSTERDESRAGDAREFTFILRPPYADLQAWH